MPGTHMVGQLSSIYWASKNPVRFRTERDAFGSDEYHPISHTGSNMTKDHGYGYTIIDTLDTMLIMNLDVEYIRSRSWVERDLDFHIDGIYNVFEVMCFPPHLGTRAKRTFRRTFVFLEVYFPRTTSLVIISLLSELST